MRHSLHSLPKMYYISYHYWSCRKTSLAPWHLPRQMLVGLLFDHKEALVVYGFSITITRIQYSSSLYVSILTKEHEGSHTKFWLFTPPVFILLLICLSLSVKTLSNHIFRKSLILIITSPDHLLELSWMPL